MNDLVLKWEKSGLLEGIDSSDKPLLANYFESMMNHVIGSKPLDKVDEEISIWIFPLIRRVYTHIKNVDVFDLKTKFENFVKNGKMELYALQFVNYQGIDIEAECLGHFAEKYVKENSENPKPLI